MVLFTKEVFLQIKSLTHLHINVQNPQYPGQPTTPQWQIFIQGVTSDSTIGGMNGMPDFSIYITCESKEDAYRMYNDLIKQVIDSGEVPKLNDQQFDKILKEK